MVVFLCFFTKKGRERMLKLQITGKKLILSGLVLGGVVTLSFGHCGHCGVGDKKTGDKIVGAPQMGMLKEKKAGAIGPRWTYGIMVKNGSDKEIRVRVDGGDVNGYIAIPAGQEKLLNSLASMPDGKKGVYWISGDFEYTTAKYAKPDYIVIKNGNLYTMTSMDGTKDMGGWTAVTPVNYDGKAEAKKIK